MYLFLTKKGKILFLLFFSIFVSLIILKYKYDNTYVRIEVIMQESSNVSYLDKYEVTKNSLKGSKTIYGGSVKRKYIKGIEDDKKIKNFEVLY